MSAAVVPHRSRLRSAHRPSFPGRAAMSAEIVVGLTIVAAALRFVRIGHQSFWYDESFTALLVHHSPGKMLGLLPETELTPPLYYCVAWVWAHIFGYGEAALRSLSALAGVATVPAMYGAGAKLVTRRVGLVAAALACFNPFLIWYSQEARSYSMLVLLATLSLLAFAYARCPEPAARHLWGWAIMAGLTLLTHYYAVVAVVPQALWLLWVHRHDRRVLLTVAGVGAVGLALLPLAISQRPQASWIAQWPLDQRLSQIAPQYLLGTGTPARTPLKLAGAVAVVVAVVMLAWRANGTERRGGLLAGGLALLGFLIALGLVPAGVDELITRNVLLVLIPLIVLIASGLGARRAGLVGLLGATILCVVGLVAAVAVTVDWDLQRPNWRKLAQAIGPEPHGAAGRAILLQNTGKILPLPLYTPGLRFMKASGARVDELDLIAFTHGHRGGWFCWWGSTCNLRGSTVDESIRLRGFHRYAPPLRVDEFVVLRLRSDRGIRLTPRQVSRAVPPTPNIPWYTLAVQPARRAHGG